MINTAMLSKSRLTLCVAACLLLSNCQLINTALRLAPLLMMVENDPRASGSHDQELRGREIERKGPRGGLPERQDLPQAVAFKR